MEIEIDKKELINDADKDDDVTKKNLKFLTTDLLQFLRNDKNNEFNDSVAFDELKKQKFMIKNLCSFNGLNYFKDNEKFKGSPGDFKREELIVRKFFNENQAFNFEHNNEKIKFLNSNLIENNIKKINKYVNFLTFLQSKDFEYNMSNNIDFYKYITYHPYLKFLNQDLIKDLNEKYSLVGRIKNELKNNTEYKFSDASIASNFQEEEYEDDDYNEDEEFYESGDEIV